jgi:hypothetical protein
MLLKPRFLRKCLPYYGLICVTICNLASYTIPGTDGDLEEGRRLINWVWYCDSIEGSKEHVDLMTDRHGKLHHFNLPIDAMRAEVWIPQLERADSSLPPQFSELVRKTTEPFIQSITDVLPSNMTFFKGKVLLVGDAVSTFRYGSMHSFSSVFLIFFT